MKSKRGAANSPSRGAKAFRLLMFACTSVFGAWILTQTLGVKGQTETGIDPKTGSLSGRVSAGGGHSSPLAGVTVALLNIEDGSVRRVVTESPGSFGFSKLPAGHFMIAASKPGYPHVSYGAPAEGKQGLTLAVARGQAVNDVGIVFPPGAVLSGRILDSSGIALAGATVSALEHVNLESGPRWISVGTAASDDRGDYRLYGLPPGTYVIAVAPQSASMGARSSAPGQARGAPDRLGPTTQRARQQFVPMFFPGTIDPAHATALALAPGEQKAVGTFTFQFIPAVEAVGRVQRQDGRPLSSRILITEDKDSIFLALGEARVRELKTPDGRFILQGLNHADYSVLALADGSPSTDAGATPNLEAVANIATNWDQHFVGIDTMVLRPGATISGTVVFSGRPVDVEMLKRTSVHLSRTDQSTSLEIEPVHPASDGSFAIAGIPPGQYKIEVNLPAQGHRWYTESIALERRDVSDLPIDFGPNQKVEGLAIRLTDAPPTISGRLYSSGSSPATAYDVMVFSVDPASWSQGSRRVRFPLRCATDGSFSFAGLFPGDYYLAAFTGPNPDAWADAAFLQSLIPGAIHLHLKPSEHVNQDIRVVGK